MYSVPFAVYLVSVGTIENALEIKEFYTFFEDVFPPHFKFVGESHDFYEAFVIYDGRARVVVDNNSFYIKERQMYVYTPGVFHSIYNDDDKPCTMQIISFSASSFPRTSGIYELSQDQIDRLKHLSASFVECLKIIPLAEIPGQVFEKANTRALVRGTEKGFEIETAILKKKLEIFFLEILSSRDSIVSDDDDALKDSLKTILSFLTSNLHSRITTLDIAKATLMSVPYIEKIFHEYMGIGVMKYYNVMKMQEALNLLSNGHSIKDVSIILGFANQNYFSTAFKKHFGFPPRNAPKSQDAT